MWDVYCSLEFVTSCSPKKKKKKKEEEEEKEERPASKGVHRFTIGLKPGYWGSPALRSHVDSSHLMIKK